MRRVLVVAAAASLAWLAGCGGGGGGGDGSSSASSNPVVYVGSSSAAVITATNAGALAANLAGNGSAVSSSLSVAGNAQFPDAGQAEVGRGINRVVRRGVVLPRNEGGRLAMAIPVDETQPCDSGSTRVSGTLADDGSGTLAVAFNECRTGDDTLSGSATMRVDAITGGTITDYTLGISRITVRGPGLSADVGGSLRSQLNLATNTETITENAVVLDNLTGRMTKSENLVLVDIYSNVFPQSYLETVTGRIYDSVHGFVDITTLVQLFFGNLTDDFPSSGVVQLTGASGARIRASVGSGNLVTLALDLNGDSNFEQTATLTWADIAGPVGANLADSDGDGMHDSWELARGLNPSDPADGPTDGDVDGASNLNEYLAGTDPANVASVPPTAGLSVTASDSPDPTTLGNNVTYTLTVVNSAASSAANVVLTDTLPPGVNFVAASVNQGACFGTGPVICNIGTLGPSVGATVTIVVLPTVEGSFTNSATVTTSSLDPTTSDNTAVSTTTIGQPLGGIQAMIDAASDGGTVNVTPGTYFGNLNFNGKNILLQSTAGPVSTVLHGNNGTAVRMGPGGTIRGFTITGAFASFGAGIEVFGTGSLIVGNIFEANMLSGGGFGAAIGSATDASPTIERNIFRNHTNCAGGVVAFVSLSSPLIINNIFRNNACPALNLSLPTGQAPQIINNTFVGNAIAIQVRRGVPQVTQVYRNNLIAQNGVGWAIDAINGTTDAENPVWENNLVFDNTPDYQGTANQTGMNGNISGDPLFVDQAAGNYQLQLNSPAIDAGSGTGAPTTDFDGVVPRPLDGDSNGSATVDIGAFEKIP